MTQARRLRAVDRAAGVLGSAGNDRAALQRVPPAVRRVARCDGGRRHRSARERRPHPVVVLVRASDHSAGLPRRARASRTRSASSTATSRSTGSPRSCSPPRNAHATCRIRRCTSPATRKGARASPRCRRTGRSTTSWTPGSRSPNACGTTRVCRLADIDLPQLYDGFSPFIYFWLESLGFCDVGEAHAFVQDGRIRDRRRAPDPLRRRRARQRSHARHPADARVLPAAVGPVRRRASCRT